MATRDLFYDVRDHRFISKEDAVRIMREQLNRGNLDAMTDRKIEYGFPPGEEAQIMKIRVKVDPLQQSAELLPNTQTATLYYDRRERTFPHKTVVRRMMAEAIEEGNLDLMTDRTHEYGFAPGIGCLHATRIVKISVIVS